MKSIQPLEPNNHDDTTMSTICKYSNTKSSWLQIKRSLSPSSSSEIEVKQEVPQQEAPQQEVPQQEVPEWKLKNQNKETSEYLIFLLLNLSFNAS